MKITLTDKYYNTYLETQNKQQSDICFNKNTLLQDIYEHKVASDSVSFLGLKELVNDTKTKFTNFREKQTLLKKIYGIKNNGSTSSRFATASKYFDNLSLKQLHLIYDEAIKQDKDGQFTHSVSKILALAKVPEINLEIICEIMNKKNKKQEYVFDTFDLETLGYLAHDDLLSRLEILQYTTSAGHSRLNSCYELRTLACMDSKSVEKAFNFFFECDEKGGFLLSMDRIEHIATNYPEDKIKILEMLYKKHNVPLDSDNDDLDKMINYNQTQLRQLDELTDLYKKYFSKEPVNYNNNRYIDYLSNAENSPQMFKRYIDLLDKMLSGNSPEKFSAFYKLAYAAKTLTNLVSCSNDNDADILFERYKQVMTDFSLTDPDSIAKIAGFDFENYDKLKSIYEYFSEKKSTLQQHNIEEINNRDIIDLSLNAMPLIKAGLEDVVKRAVELKYTGLSNLLTDIEQLEKFPLKDLLLEKLSCLTSSAQKLEQLRIVLPLIHRASDNVIKQLIDNIKSPEMTQGQIDLANEIFTSQKSYEEQIEEFINRFEVSENKRELLKKYLRTAKLNTKILYPQSLEKQKEIMRIKINSIENNINMPRDVKEKKIKILNDQLQDIVNNPLNYLRPQINEYALISLAQQVEAHVNIPAQKLQLNRFLNEYIYKMLNIDIQPELMQKIEYDKEYIPDLFYSITQSKNSAHEGLNIDALFQALQDAFDNNENIENSMNEYTDFAGNFRKLIALLNTLVNSDNDLSDVLDMLPENVKTHELFEQNGLCYQKWTKFDKDFYYPFIVNVDTKDAIRKAASNLKIELLSASTAKLDKTEVEKLKNILKENKIEQAGQKELSQIIKLIEQELEKNQYWKKDEAAIKTFKDHIKIHKKNIQSLKNLKDTTEELRVRLWNKDDIGRNLFIGNHVGCCTAVGSFNDFAAPQHIMNSFINAIEIVDKSGNSFGNSMCYFAKVDGKLTFIIDSFEANGKLGSSPEVTKAIIEFSKEICKRMGRPDARIMFGPRYNKIDLSKLKLTYGHTIEIIGCCKDETYIDSTNDKVNTIAKNCSMHEII